MRKKIAILLTVVIISSLLAGCFGKKQSSGPVDLIMYGLDDSDVIEPIIEKYREKYSAVRIKYKKFADSAAFEDLLVNEIAEGEGPDIFYIHNTWLPRHIKKIVPLQSETLPPEKFMEIFANVASKDFIQPDPNDGDNKIYALPLYVDTLALYYNKKDFEQKFPERGKPAANWEIFKNEADQLRQQGSNGALEHGAISLGRADNIRLASDVLYNFFLQGGVSFYDDSFKKVMLSGDASKYFDYFLSFADSKNKNFSWSFELAPPSSNSLNEVEAFLSLKTSSILAYSDLYPRLETELKNVKTRAKSTISLSDIGVMPVPQFADNEADYKTFANYYGLAVSRNSKNSAVAWDFIKFLTTSSQNAGSYHSKTKKPAALRDLVEAQKKEPVIEVFISQLGYADSFRIFSDSKFANALKEAITAANQGQSSHEALNQAIERMNEILKVEAPEGLYPKPKIKKKK
ncbi:extracellular solute-binding protein [Candidatus Peregrinibacteria bacterium]|nr:extracellular solute-binding protein [Candidatus Peregrinibacteria bacterium]